MILAWRFAGIMCIAIGGLGVFLPLLPTTPFLLLASAAFAKGSPQWRHWLVSHPRFGPAIHAWKESRAIPYRAKVAAIASLLFSLALSVALALPSWALALQALALLGVAAFILRCPTAEVTGCGCSRQGS